MGWWSLRWSIVTDSKLVRERRIWAFLEILCASLTILSLLVAITKATLLHSGYGDLSFIPNWGMQIALAGSVGYGTNFLAVQMLFKPEKPIDWFPMKWLWRQGLIPAKQDEMAEVVGEEVASKLLTPETVSKEISQIVTDILEDKTVTQEFSDAIIEMAVETIPPFVDDFFVELMDGMKDILVDSVPNEAIQKKVLELANSWMKEPQRIDRFSNIALAFLADHSDELTDLIKKLLKRYKKSSSSTSALGISLAEGLDVIKWSKVEHALRHVLAKPRGKRWIVNFSKKLGNRIPLFLEVILDDNAIEQLKIAISEMVEQPSAEVMETSVTPRLTQIVKGEHFRKFLINDLIPRGKEQFIEWNSGGRLKTFLDKFNVSTRVREAAESLETKELEEMANRVGAYHFGAIQVLGYVLGTLAGVLIVLADG
jgi:uncharacterized membrane protein YheB (UPF0754 family)